MTGRPLARAALAASAALLAGCVSVGIGNSDAPAMAYYVLQDARAAAAAAPAPDAGRTVQLAIQSVGGDPLTDSTAMVYSRRPGERALYQLAAWSERPPRRIVQLVQQRLEAGGRLAAVTQLGQPVQSDWLLSLATEQLFHDASTSPGSAVLALRAELIDRRSRSRLAWRRFAAAPPLAASGPADAAAAFAQATADVLDQLVPWVESTLAAQPAR